MLVKGLCLSLLRPETNMAEGKGTCKALLGNGYCGAQVLPAEDRHAERATAFAGYRSWAIQ
jgi:hypothetical protein